MGIFYWGRSKWAWL